MPEGNANAEIADHLREHGSSKAHGSGSRRRLEWIEILEAVLLAVVALATAWSGLQSAKWDGSSDQGLCDLVASARPEHGSIPGR